MLINTFNRHGDLTTDFVKVTIIPMIKNKTGYSSDKIIYIDRLQWSLPHLDDLEFVCLKFYKCTLLHIIKNLDLKQNILLTCVFLQ